MSRGELMFEDNQVKESALSAPADWAAEYQQQHSGGDMWADQFVQNEASTNWMFNYALTVSYLCI